MSPTDRPPTVSSANTRSRAVWNRPFRRFLQAVSDQPVKRRRHVIAHGRELGRIVFENCVERFDATVAGEGTFA